jgi:hypothetical protein
MTNSIKSIASRKNRRKWVYGRREGAKHVNPDLEFAPGNEGAKEKIIDLSLINVV